MTSKKTQEQRAEAIDSLRAFLKPGDTVTTTVMHVSRSGMSRVIMCQAVGMQDGKPYIRDISWLVSRAVGYPLDEKNGGVKIGGCGMNMCFALVYELGSVLFPDGFGIVGYKPHPTLPGKHKRPKTKAEAARMVRNGWRFAGRNGDSTGWDNSGGYALNYR